MRFGIRALGGILSVAVAFICDSAHAILVPLNSGFGPNTIIVDTNSGIEWLKLNVVFNLSFNEVSSLIANNTLFGGFRFATFDQYCSLVRTNVGLNCSFSESGDPDIVQRALSFINLFGPTGTNSVNGAAGPMLGSNGSFIAISAFVSVSIPFPETPAGLARTDTESGILFSPDRRTNYYLIRVSEPATLAISIGGLVMLLMVVWRRSLKINLQASLLSKCVQQ